MFYWYTNKSRHTGALHLCSTELMLSRQQQPVCRQLRRLLTAEWDEAPFSSIAVSLKQKYDSSLTVDDRRDARELWSADARNAVLFVNHQLNRYGSSRHHHHDNHLHGGQDRLPLRSRRKNASFGPIAYKRDGIFGAACHSSAGLGIAAHGARESFQLSCSSPYSTKTGSNRRHASQQNICVDKEEESATTKHDGHKDGIQGGWSYEAVVNLPNSLSMLRLLSGPAIAHLIIQNQMNIAIPALVLSALTDWLDGYVARKQLTTNVLGSYLDPLADKVLVGSVVLALGYSGALPLYLFNLIVGRDVLLISGACIARGQTLGWRWPGVTTFFNISGEATAPDKPAAPKVEPLYISKVNTVFQLTLISSCLTDAWIGWPGPEITLGILGPTTAMTTIWSFVAYIYAYKTGRISM